MDLYRSRVFCVALLAGLLAGCSAVGNSKVGPRPASVGIGSDVARDSGSFIVAENMLDTWNTIGKILVALDGITYEGRAQMLGLYSVRYRGEQLLIRTQAVVIGGTSQGIHTKVDALGATGKPIHSAAAMALLHLLEQRVPQEVSRYRQRIKLPPLKPARKRSVTPRPGKAHSRNQ